jgi:hypothetical protein
MAKRDFSRHAGCLRSGTRMLANARPAGAAAQTVPLYGKTTMAVTGSSNMALLKWILLL